MNNKVNLGVDQQWDILGLSNNQKTVKQPTHPQAQWFDRVGLGLFIHWGIASVHGSLDLSWGMMRGTSYDTGFEGRNKVTPNAYWKLAEHFNPKQYDPGKYLNAAAEAGFDYAVLTTMHHDGYTLWPSAYSEMGTHRFLGGRDLVGEYVDACRASGMKVGFYLSPTDWYFDRHYMSFNADKADGARPLGLDHEWLDEVLPIPQSHKDQLRKLLFGRVQELLTRYGKIDLMWFDGGVSDPELMQYVRQLQPHIVINARKGPGDFDCTECRLPMKKFTGWFEMPHCWIETGVYGAFSESGTVDMWGYHQDEQYRSTAWMLSQLAYLRTWGGNLLINVSPRPDGSLPEQAYERFDEVRSWMQFHREAIVDIQPGPYPEICNMPVTVKGHDWYIFVLPDSGSFIQLPHTKILQSAIHVKTEQQLEVKQNESNCLIHIKHIKKNDTVEVIRLTFSI